jgi:fumarate reductase subunit D
MIHYVYSIYFWLANVASLGMIPSSFLEQYVSFWIAYIMTTVVLCLSCLVLWLGKHRFGKQQLVYLGQVRDAHSTA